ncbi:monovalent cation/H+ antiporter subunit D [Pseudoxanthomonas dokdonensis]|uniref:Cation:proton antiporter n=1 Tax=Pseudoxanthomonas dokdonensis TaxID=344882 RepID=A0A0R0CUH6_9GAMM|nr:monovalent cation/H+ antiporter subunit D [Pseudoxanthomonas dokdonensis]KRG69582.1 cation:proton antiporter [Pseudoxanthomonas dokdonensis]
MNPLVVLPILLPLLTGALVLMSERRGIVVQRLVSWLGVSALLAVCIALLVQASDGTVQVYLLGDWPARLGIALVLDRLSAMMALTTALLAVACLLYACGGWDRRAPHFHALFQLQLMGINGAFLTGDIFNLFVFFEVLLIASYGLMGSGGRRARMRIGLHYVAFNVMASTLFLIALGLLYGLIGTLNMAEIGLRLSEVSPQDARLLQAALGLMLVVFCAKAALLPLYFWLPEAYGRAPAAVAALFVIMTKVGLYAVLRVGTLVLGAGLLSGFAWQALLFLGMLTLLLAGVGVLAAARLRTLVAYLVLVSAATLFVAFALQRVDTIGAGLYYLAHSTFVAAALFLLADIVRRRRGRAQDWLQVVAPMPEKTLPALLFLLAAVSVAGLPPLSGFLGKLMLMQATPAVDTPWVWTALLLSSFMVVTALARAGSRMFWRVAPEGDGARADPVPWVQTGAVVLLLGYGIVMTVLAGPISNYTRAAASQILDPAAMIDDIRHSAPLHREPSP